jgi:ABC-type Zn uptake system ZnuABC Zn-binding protein ZnuA
MVGSDIVDALKFHNARCILHSNIFKDAIIRENMRLAARILDKHSQLENVAKPTRRVREEYFSAIESETEAEAKHTRTNPKSKHLSI